MINKQFVHDCEKCKFLGNSHNIDYYVCVQLNEPALTTLIARYGDDGPGYSSCDLLVFADSVDRLKHAPDWFLTALCLYLKMTHPYKNQ